MIEKFGNFLVSLKCLAIWLIMALRVSVRSEDVKDNEAPVCAERAKYIGPDDPARPDARARGCDIWPGSSCGCTRRGGAAFDS